MVGHKSIRVTQFLSEVVIGLRPTLDKFRFPSKVHAGLLLLLLLLLLSRFSRVQLCATPETAAHQAPPSLGFSRQETGVGCHFLLQCMKVKSESEVT